MTLTSDDYAHSGDGCGGNDVDDDAGYDDDNY